MVTSDDELSEESFIRRGWMEHSRRFSIVLRNAEGFENGSVVELSAMPGDDGDWELSLIQDGGQGCRGLDDVVLLTCGRFTHWRQVDKLIEALTGV
jgi:hypothetical protein